ALAVIAGHDRGAGHAHDRRVLTAVGTHGYELVAVQAIDAPVAPRNRAGTEPGLAAVGAFGPELHRRVGHAARLAVRAARSELRHPAARRRRAMKNPSVPSRCGSSWRWRGSSRSAHSECSEPRASAAKSGWA